MSNIDTMKMVREIRDKQYRATKGKSFKDLIQYFRSKAAKLPEIIRKKSLVKAH